MSQSGCTMALGGIVALPTIAATPSTQNDDSINWVGPKSGYTPQIGTLVSMMNWMRNTVLRSLDGMTVKDLDYIHDDDSNSIGAMLWHLASTERFYQINTFQGKPWGEWSEEDDNKWSLAMSLGAAARAEIKGHDLDFYLEKLNGVREDSLKELAERDDEWLLAEDPDWGWSGGVINNYCKWFHVVEHESNHNGQIKWLASRVA